MSQPQRLVLTREDLERLILERNSLMALLDALRQNILLVSQTLEELKSAKEFLSLLTKNAIGDSYAEIGGGVFVKAIVNPGDKVLVNVGANYVVEMNVENAIRYIDERIKEYENLKSQLTSQASAVSRRLSEIENILAAVAAAIRRQAQEAQTKQQ